MAAFERAAAEGARALELDVRTGRDGAVVVFHDETLGRMTRGRDGRRVADVPDAELLRIDMGGGVTVPTLAEVLAWARGKGIGVNVEMKHEVPSRRALARDTAAVVRASRADVLLSSFDPLLLAMVGVCAPAVPRALLAHHDQNLWADALMEMARPAVVAALHVERTQVEAAAFARYRRRRLRVGVWTVNDPAEARELARLGAASIITDRPGDVLAAL
jgi:glycerophosphoryl diester phosphodiesterase